MLIIDEVAGPIIPEQDRASTARQLADPDYGVGCAAVAFLCPIKPASKHGPVPPGLAEQLVQLLQEQAVAEAFIVRTFLSSGHELALSATTLCAVADYLYRRDGRREVWLVAGTAISSLSLHYVYRDLNNPLYNAAIGQPARLSEQFINSLYSSLAAPIQANSVIEVLRPIITLSDGAWPFVLYGVCTGEPHLVCFVGKKVPAEGQSELLIDIFEHPAAVQATLFGQVMAHLNGCPEVLSTPIYPGETLTPPTSIFNPDEGVNLVFARVNGDSTIDARFYRRGSCREVRLSGTGAVAATLVAHELGLLPRPCAEVRGWLNIAEGRQEPVVVQRIGEVWWLEAPVELIWAGDLKVMQQGGSYGNQILQR